METNGKSSANPELITGDLFYVTHDDAYHVHKLLASDKSISTYHVLAYEPLDRVPSAKDVAGLKIAIYHFPIDNAGFENPVVLGNTNVLAHELAGYHEYLRQTQAPENYTSIALDYFRNALFLTNEHKHEEAIDSYSKALDLIPLFFEAFDNRAFCKMDLGLWEAAIADFHRSMQVNPVSVLAEFSIGECYLKMKRYPEAKAQFEKALTIDPDHQLSKDFLEKTRAFL